MGFAKLPESVVAALPKLSGSAVKVAVALASFMDKSGACFPTVESIATRAGHTQKRTTERALSRLKRLGLVRSERGYHHRPNVYWWAETDPAKNDGSNAFRPGQKRTLDPAKNDAQKSTNNKRKTAKRLRFAHAKDSKTAAVKAWFSRRYREATGAACEFNHGRDGKLLKGLLIAHGEEAVKKTVEAMFTHYGEEKFPFKPPDPSPPDIGCLKRHWNRFAPKAARPKTAGQYKLVSEKTFAL